MHYTERSTIRIWIGVSDRPTEGDLSAALSQFYDQIQEMAENLEDNFPVRILVE